MRAVIQRVENANVAIDGKEAGKILQGLLILLGVTHEDSDEDVEWLVNKIVQMRIFADNEGKMNLSLIDVKGEVLVISQFTLFASTKKGNRPSYIQAARPEYANNLYKKFISRIKGEAVKVETGIFGADMSVSLINDGPVTIIIDSKTRE